MSAPEFIGLEEREDKFVGLFVRHFVSLACVHAAIGTQREQYETKRRHSFNVSGFVISVAGEWLWVTAGHIIDEVDKLLREGRKLTYCRFLDWGASRKYHDTIPVEFDALRKGRVGGDDDCDCAAFPLSLSYRQMLESNGVVALDEAAWAAPPCQEKVDCCLLLGIPDELTVRHVNGAPGRHSIEVSPTCTLHFVRPELATPPDFSPKKAARIYGKVELRGPKCLESIAGMSGGPLFAVKRETDGTIRYWVVGVQSSWHKPTRMIAAWPIADFFNRVRQVLIDRAGASRASGGAGAQ